MHTTIGVDVAVVYPHEIDILARKVLRLLGGRLRDFRLLIHQNGVILQGIAVSYHAKQLAQHAIMRASPIPIVANEIEVCGFDAFQVNLAYG